MSSTKVLIASLLYQTDRVLLHTEALDVLAEANLDVTVWSRAPADPSFPRDHPRAASFEPFAFREAAAPRWIDALRWITTYAVDQHPEAATRKTHWEYKGRQTVGWKFRALQACGRAVDRAGATAIAMRLVDRLGARLGARSSVVADLARLSPDLVVFMHPFHETEWSVALAARQLGIPTLAYITSWDNVTSQRHLVIPFDGYVVWSEHLRNELLRFYVDARDRFTRACGAPQYDFFSNQRFLRSRADFLARFGLDPARPVILYSLGSPDLVAEDWGAKRFVDAAKNDPRFRGAQFIVRLHPAFPPERYTQIEALAAEHPDVVIQQSASGTTWEHGSYREDWQIVEWVNTLRHADVIINFSSTMAVDGSVCDRPIVNLDFDPTPGEPDARLVRAINDSWNHLVPVMRTGAMRPAHSIAEMLDEAAAYLADPARDHDGRKRLVDLITGEVDGHAGRRLGQAIAEFAASLAAG